MAGGKAVAERRWAPDRDLLLDIYYHMVLTRALDERIHALQRQGRIRFAISCRGHEGAQVASALALRKGYDYFVPYYRSMASAIAAGLTPRDVMCDFYAREASPCSRGRQMPVHWSSRRLNIVSGSSCVATQIPHAVGIGLGWKLRGEDRVAIVYFGDGATSEGDFHEALNFAAIHSAPVIFFCENNGYAISVPQRLQMAIENVADRASAYGLPGVTVDGADPVAVYEATAGAAERARTGLGPTLIEARVPRLCPHSIEDDQRAYRSDEELEREAARDPIPNFRSRLVSEGLLNDEEDERLRGRISEEIEDAQSEAERSPLPDAGGLQLYVTEDSR